MTQAVTLNLLANIFSNHAVSVWLIHLSHHDKYFTLKLSVELSLGSFLRGTTCLLQSVKQLYEI